MTTERSAKADRVVTIGDDGATYAVRDTRRDPAPIPCPDCGRSYLQGENVTWTVPAPEGGYRAVWSGCCDCWLRRTNPPA